VEGELMKYQVTIESNGTNLVAVITDTTTGTKVFGKLQPYTRTKNGETTQYMQIAFDAEKLGCENRGVVQVPKNNAGKFMRAFETNLDNKKASSTKLNFDMFA
jgi:hypothetical protein